MRSKPLTSVGVAIAIFGVVCLAAAALLAWVVVPNRKQVPADLNTTRQLTGTASVLLNPQAIAAGDMGEAVMRNVPVRAERTVTALATDGQQAQVVDKRSLSTATGQPVGASEATYAVDRRSLEAAGNPPANWTVVPHEGLTISWPIGAEQRNYTGWVNETQSTTDIRYVREEERAGVNTYVYESSTPAAPIKDAQVLASLPRELPAAAMTGLVSSLDIPPELQAKLAQALPTLGNLIKLAYTYESTSTYWVEPTTGLVVDTDREETRKAGIALPSGEVLAALPIYRVSTAFTQESAGQAADDAEQAKSTIELYGSTWPTILVTIGVITLILGIALAAIFSRPRVSRPRADRTAAGTGP